VRGVFQADPLDGNLFLFVNRRGDRIKAMWWDRDGLALFVNVSRNTAWAAW
jgi:transposase